MKNEHPYHLPGCLDHEKVGHTRPPPIESAERCACQQDMTSQEVFKR